MRAGVLTKHFAATAVAWIRATTIRRRHWVSPANRVAVRGVIGRIKELRETSFIIQSAEKSFIEIARTAVVGKRAEK